MRGVRRNLASKHHTGAGPKRIPLLRKGLTPLSESDTGLGGSMCHSDVITRYGGSRLRDVH
jgi:hypothetical protein